MKTTVSIQKIKDSFCVFVNGGFSRKYKTIKGAEKAVEKIVNANTKNGQETMFQGVQHITL